MGMRRVLATGIATVALIVIGAPAIADTFFSNTVEITATYYLNRPSQPGDFAIISAAFPSILPSFSTPTDGGDFSIFYEEDAGYTVSLLGVGAVAGESTFISASGGIINGQPFAEGHLNDFSGTFIDLGIFSGVTGFVVDESVTVSLSCFNADCFVENGFQNFVGVNIFGDGLGDSLAAPIPEPPTWAMMLLGFVSLGLLTYRRKIQIALN